MESEIDKTEVVSDTDEQDHQQPDEIPPPQRPSGHIDREHPIGGEMSDILRGLFRHLRLPWLTQRYAQTPVLALFSFVNGCISIGLMSVLALITRSPFIFPSLGPTAFLFFYTPRAQRLAAQHAGWSHHRSAGRVLQPGGHRSDGCRSGAGRRGDMAPRHRCRALARSDGGPDGSIQVASSSRGGNDADRLARHADQTLAIALAARRRGAAHPASLRH
jgi:hypothetical protein